VKKPRVGISACLLGSPVRYDGGHKRHRYVCEVLAEVVEWVPVCPEVELGLGVPRETLRLERRDGQLALVATSSRRDLTAAMCDFAEERVRALAAERLSGYVLKARSPSCGIEAVEVFTAPGPLPSADGRGLFAEALLRRFPDLPVVQEPDLDDESRRGLFLERVLRYHSLAALAPR
jgi:uncharacterized protein YbbK (DUF523 family)